MRDARNKRAGAAGEPCRSRKESSWGARGKGHLVGQRESAAAQGNCPAFSWTQQKRMVCPLYQGPINMKSLLPSKIRNSLEGNVNMCP